MLLLLSCWIIAGITAEDPQRTHYRLKNSSFCLHVEKSLNDIIWTFNRKVIVLNKKVKDDYRDKVDYNPNNISLCINKLNETDSGSYEVSASDSTGNHVSRELHTLIIQETVPRPVIRMSVIHSNLSTGFCNITVNCSIQDDWVWSVCDEDRCRTSQTSLLKVNITMSVDNRSVVCIGNNHVSTNNISQSTEAVCFIKSNPEQEETSKLPYLVIIITVTVIVIALSVLLCAFILFAAKGRFSTDDNHYQAQTSPAHLIPSQPVEAQPQPVARVSTSSSSAADVSYENVDTTQLNQTSSPTISPREELGAKQNQNVDTVYSFLQVTNVTASDKGHMKIPEASSSQSVSLDGPEQQVDTVYSLLQKPKNVKS